MMYLTVLLLVAVTGVLSTSQVPKCTTEIVQKVQSQWKETGVPKGVTGFKDSFKVIAGSSSPISQQGVCKTFKFTKGSLYDETDKKSLSCKEQNGILSLPDSLSYVVAFGNGVLVTVRCSKDGPTPTKDNPPVVALGVSDKATDSDVKKYFDILTKLGISVKYYKCN